MASRTITAEDNFEIQPKDIDASKHLWEAFDHCETEISAGYIVRLCQELGEWHPFTKEQIEAFYQKSGHHEGFIFNRLVNPGMTYGIRTGRYPAGGGWVVLGEDGKYRVTEDFIRRCYKSSPTQRR